MEFAQKLGLNSKDWQIYQNLWQFGASAASTLASRTGIDRTTVYAVLKRLMRKGFITKSMRAGTAVFTALNPEVFATKIERIIEEKQKELLATQKLIEQLQQMQNQGEDRPQIEIFEGAEAVISLYETLLKNNRLQSAFLTIDELPASLKVYLQKEYIKNKIKNGVYSRVLIQDSLSARHYQKLDAKANRETRILAKGKNSFETEVIIGEKDSVALIDFQNNPIGVLLKSTSIRNTLLTIFEELWSQAILDQNSLTSKRARK